MPISHFLFNVFVYKVDEMCMSGLILKNFGDLFFMYICVFQRYICAPYVFKYLRRSQKRVSDPQTGVTGTYVRGWESSLNPPQNQQMLLTTELSFPLLNILDASTIVCAQSIMKKDKKEINEGRKEH